MNFIERFFNIFPDGGSGATELVWLAVALFAIASVLIRKRVTRAAWWFLTAASRTFRRNSRPLASAGQSVFGFALANLARERNGRQR
jgi:uncharacterized membrane protein